MSERWPDALLDKHRAIGDPPADGLVEKLFDPSRNRGFGRLGYNHLLDLADALLDDPELLLVKGSECRRQIDRVPDDFLEYFRPMPAPAWVDAEKLRLAATLWSKWTLPMFMTLYVRSLPTCYLLKDGIAALYDTGKLREKKYLSQRLYETALFIEAVLDERNGIRVVSDITASLDDHVAEAVGAVDTKGGWEWEGRRLARSDGTEAHFTPEQMKQIRDQVHARRDELPAGRFLWGAGYIAAKKVRFLHASMRFMLVGHPVPADQAANPRGGFETLSGALGSSGERWQAQAHGGPPINQEQAAFALNTFGITILDGLDQWGCTVTEEERGAYLHLWKVVGHIMGIEEELLTDKPGECRDLMARTLKRNGGASENGYKLTKALVDWLEDYLPHAFGMNKYLAPYLIKWHMGKSAEDVLRGADIAKRTFFWRRLLFHAAVFYLRLFDRISSWWVRIAGTTTSPSMRRIHDASVFIIESLKSAYSRRAFYVPRTPTEWVRQYEAGPGFMAKLRAWRRTMFNRLFLGVGMAVASHFLLVVALVLLVLESWQDALVAATVALLATLASSWVLGHSLPRAFKRRPEIEEHDLIDSTPESGLTPADR